MIKEKLILAARILLLLAIAGTLTFIFYQSCLPQEESSEVSNNVSNIIEPIIPSDTPAGQKFHANIREWAHFIEFAALGTEVALYVAFFLLRRRSKLRPKVSFIIYSFIAAPILALLDETLQIFTERGPEIKDVWIDTLGFVSLATVVYAVYIAAVLIMRRLRSSRQTARETVD